MSNTTPSTSTLDALDLVQLDEVAGGKLNGTFSQSHYSSDYTVGRGDNLTRVAEHAGLSVPQLVKLNPRFASNPDLIHPGDHVVTGVRK